MDVKLKKIRPSEIEAESFRMIEAELGPVSHGPSEFSVIRRVIHATGDFSFSENMRFHPYAVNAGLSAIRKGRNILTDVNMVEAGINKKLIANFGCKAFCRINDPEVAEKAAKSGQTRSWIAMRNAEEMNIGIVAIGNAPTALLSVMELVDKGLLNPDLVIGVPVGFVNAAESKQILSCKSYPFITSLGRKGGSPVAAAVVNALSRLAGEA